MFHVNEYSLFVNMLAVGSLTLLCSRLPLSPNRISDGEDEGRQSSGSEPPADREGCWVLHCDLTFFYVLVTVIVLTDWSFHWPSIG